MSALGEVDMASCAASEGRSKNVMLDRYSVSGSSRNRTRVLLTGSLCP